MSDELDQYLKGWDLLPDGEPFATFSGVLQPVRLSGAKCMLKVARREKDRRAGELLVWWNGEGAVKVLAHDRNAILMERATGASSLAAMATGGRDDEATGILCDVIQRLHSRKPPYPEQLIPL
ncbi:MAG TPA: aminoglycoside phosphotransferase family protein, partial [Puia sp.]|nr:aminoglycoside phosphotransferase family protein [Puia sp.]